MTASSPIIPLISFLTLNERRNLLFSDWFYIILGMTWLGTSIAGGAVLALLAKRIHKTISFQKNWLFFSALLAIVTAMIFGVAIR